MWKVTKIVNTDGLFLIQTDLPDAETLERLNHPGEAQLREALIVEFIPWLRHTGLSCREGRKPCTCGLESALRCASEKGEKPSFTETERDRYPDRNVTRGTESAPAAPKRWRCTSCFTEHEYPGDLFSIYEAGKTVQSGTLYHWGPSGHTCGPVVAEGSGE